MPIQDNFIDTTVDEYINKELIKDNKERQLKHKASGKLSASMLFQPVKFQVLKTIGVPRKPFDVYTLGKFKRGRDVETWYVEELKKSGVLVEDPKVLWKYNLQLDEDKQPQATYRECIGYIDSIIDTDKMESKVGIIPNEIKSIVNMKWRRVKKTGIDWHYKIQACFYALAMGVEHYAVTIVSAEDLRRETHIFEVSKMKKYVDHAIGQYMIAMARFNKDLTLPKFEANEHVKWTGDLKYAMFSPEWANNPDSWVLEQLKKEKE